MNIKKSIYEILNLFKTFGILVGISRIIEKGLYRFKRYNSILFKFKHYCVKRFLKKRYKSFIKNYKIEVINKQENKTEKNIWVFWWQEMELAPEIVKKCFNKISSYDANVKLITKNNYKNYVSIPDYIIDLLNSNKITLTHFSDILRFNLLADYGGLWLDATIYVANEERLNEILKMDFYTIKMKKCPRRIVSRGLWTGFCMGGNKNNVLFSFMKKFFNEYWKDNFILIDYFLIDYMISIGYEEVEDIRILIEKNDYNNEGVNLLMENINNIFDENLYREIIDNNPIQKLSYKSKIDDKENTFYNNL